jgi:hypothetical protein
MSNPAPQAQTPKKSGGWIKAGVIGVLGLGGGIAGTYATAVVNQVVKPAKPVANFSVAADGLTVTCQNRATGESGWWDFGDGTALEPFAADAPVTHTYAKPGGYAVKLTVRNFLGEENERSVPVEVATGPKELPAPLISGFAVQSVSPVAYAPATYRVTADVVNADHTVWDFGDGRVEVAGGGKIDRMVTFDRPGAFPLVLVAHNDKQAVKQAGAVKVETPPVGSVTAVLKVTDTGSQVARHTRTESVAIPVPAGKAAQPNFTRTVQARPGSTIADADPARPSVAGVKNLKVTVAADKRSVIVSGEWAGDPKAAAKAAGGSDVIVPLKVTEVRAVAAPPAVTMVTGTIGGYGGPARCDLPLPPAPGLAGAKREYQIEIRQPGQDGKTVTTLRGPQTGTGGLTFPWSGKVTGQGWSIIYSAVMEGDKVVVTAQQGGL